MEQKKITYKYVNTGHWMARCDHSDNIIEFNKNEFFKLSYLHREYIWIHEHVHLLYEVYDENECNRITDEIFLSRSKDSNDRAKRLRFIVDSHDMSDKSHWVAVAGFVLSLLTTAGSTTMSILNRRNSGYYALSDTDKELYVDELLSNAYQQSLLTDKKSARDLFWEQLSPYVARKKESTFPAWADNNPFVWEYIDKYSTLYRVNFEDVTPIQLEKHPQYIQYQKTLKTIGVIAVIVAVIVLIIVLIKTKKK